MRIFVYGKGSVLQFREKKHYMEQINAIKSLWRILFAIPSNPFLINPIEYNNKSETHRKTRNEKKMYSHTHAADIIVTISPTLFTMKRRIINNSDQRFLPRNGNN